MLERINEVGIPQSTVGFIDRSAPPEADFDLTHNDGKYLIRQARLEVAHEHVPTSIVNWTRVAGPLELVS